MPEHVDLDAAARALGAYRDTLSAALAYAHELQRRVEALERVNQMLRDTLRDTRLGTQYDEAHTTALDA